VTSLRSYGDHRHQYERIILATYLKDNLIGALTKNVQCFLEYNKFKYTSDMTTNTCVPINFDIVADIYGKDFSSTLEKLGITDFVNINLFCELHGRYPCLSSIWGNSRGSYDYVQSGVGEVVIHNGSLSMVDNKPVPFGGKYYCAHFGVDMYTEESFLENFLNN